MKIDRTAWAVAYRFHEEALDKLGSMKQELFWEWFSREMLQISADNGNSALIMALLLAVFEDLEARDRDRSRLNPVEPTTTTTTEGA